MAGTKIKQVQDRRSQKSNHKKPYPVEGMAPYNNTEINHASKKDGLEYYNHDLGRHAWYTAKEVQALGSALVEWAGNKAFAEDYREAADTVYAFFTPRKISEDTVRHLREKFPTFAEDFKLAKELIGLTMWKGALYASSPMREGAALKYLACYNKEYKEETTRLATLKIAQEQASKPNTIIVEMVDYGGKKIPEKTDE